MKVLKKYIVIIISAILILLPCIKIYAEKSETEHVYKEGDVVYIEWEKSPDKIDYGTFTYPTADSIGSVAKYSVFSMYYNKNMHMEGTIATKTIKFGTNDAFGITNNVVDYTDPEENFIYIGDVDGPLDNLQTTNDVKTSVMILPDDMIFAKGLKTYTDTPVINNDTQKEENWIYEYYNNKEGIKFIYGDYESPMINNTSALEKSIKHESETTYVIDFDKAFKCLEKYSDTRYTMDTNEKITKVTKDDTSINIVCTKEQTNIINLTAEEIETKDITVTCVDEDGNSTLDFSLVINVKDITGNHTFDRHINVNGKETDTYGPTGASILWNFGSEYEGTVTFEKTDLGVILAPNAYVRIYNNSHDGSVWAKTVENTNCEIHQTAYKEYKLSHEDNNDQGDDGDNNQEDDGDNNQGEDGDNNQGNDGDNNQEEDGDNNQEENGNNNINEDKNDNGDDVTNSSTDNNKSDVDEHIKYKTVKTGDNVSTYIYNRS